MSILKRGMKGAPVKRLQAKLGVTADGDFGPGTQKAVREYQEKNGLAVDGIAGPETFAHMGLHELILLRVGSRGPQVKRLQEGLGIEADGIYGQGTKEAVEGMQRRHGLTIDGMAGPVTLARLPEFSEIDDTVVARAEVQPDEEHFESEDLPEFKGAEPVKGSAAEPAPKKSLWGKVKGWFG